MKKLSVPLCYKYIVIGFLVFYNVNVFSEQKMSRKSDSVQIVFYNVENLFDVVDDPETDDNEYTPQGERKWTKQRYERKINLISQAILSLSDYNYPEIIGLSEVENRDVLNKLIHAPLFSKAPYKVLQKDSPDIRGIDVALIYDTTKIDSVNIEFLKVNLSNGNKTRDILHFTALIKNDSLHLFVNHWPSRFDGARNSEESRREAAGLLRTKCDSIDKLDSNAKIIIMGDFNDEPDDESIKVLTTGRSENPALPFLVNLMNRAKIKNGTMKYNGMWYLFDQFIVSGSLLKNQTFYVSDVQVASGEFLFQDDAKYLGKEPFRSFKGFKYIGGYSDHLPIRLILHIVK